MGNDLLGKKVSIIHSDHPQNWFIVQSECSRDRNKLIVRTNIEQAGWRYGWVSKKDCVFVED